MFYKSICLSIVLIFLVITSVFAQSFQEIRLGTAVSGNLRLGNKITYSLKAPQAGILIVETLGEIDTYLIIADEQNKIIKEDDDSGRDLNAKIDLMAEAGKNYLITVSGYDGASGAFHITTRLIPVSEIRELRIGSPIPGNMSDGLDNLFRVSTPRNGFLVVETSSNLDLLMGALNEDLISISEDDDSGEDYNPKIEIVAGANKTYFFSVKGYDSDVIGPFRITANMRSFPAPTQLRVGQFQAGNVVSGESSWFSIQPARNGILIIETTGSTDTCMEAYTSDYNLIDTNDDGEDLNARIVINAEANKAYIFRVRGYDSSVTGAYRIIASFE